MTRLFEIKYTVCESLQTQNTDRMFVPSCGCDIVSLIYHSVQKPAQVYVIAISIQINLRCNFHERGSVPSP